MHFANCKANVSTKPSCAFFLFVNRLINVFILNKYVFVAVLCGVIFLVGLESADDFCEPHNRVLISLVKNVF